MNKITFWTGLTVVALVLSSFTNAFSDTEVTDLICEYHTNPIRLDVQKLE